MSHQQLVGQTIFDVTILAIGGPNRFGQITAECRCKCGKDFVAVASRIGKGTRKCPVCVKKELHKNHSAFFRTCSRSTKE